MINVNNLVKFSFVFGLFLTAVPHSYAMDELTDPAIIAQKKREEEFKSAFRAANKTSKVTEESDPDLAAALKLSKLQAQEEAEVAAVLKLIDSASSNTTAFQNTRAINSTEESDPDLEAVLKLSTLQAQEEEDLARALQMSEKQAEERQTPQVNRDALSDEEFNEFLESHNNAVVPNTYRINRASSETRGASQQGTATVALGDFLYQFEHHKDRDAIWAASRDKNEQQMKQMERVPSSSSEEILRKKSEEEKNKLEIENKRIKAIEELEKQKKYEAEKRKDS